ncbi:hypothetical protein NDU88_006945 [Pleurodeles waltl]|uniref:Peptidase A2 domain-containing protein n=1 Tax=Pleurodeles waltl TaxID=8319 RepID=A0AAV7N3X0_PLEWA|nr:hypothetical protein NDU88_006945 [Pleurodeles waltl]
MFTFPIHLSLRHTGAGFNYGVYGISGSHLRQRTIQTLRPAKFKAVQSVQPVVVMDDDDLDDDENGEGTVHMIHAMQPGGHPRKRVPRCSVLLAGHKVDALINTGASINVIATSVLQRITFQPHLRPTTTQVYTFGSSKPLPLAGVFTTLLSH